jgi:L-arabinonolactonase
MSAPLDIRRVGSIKNRVGEGPLWDVEEQALYWVDVLREMIHRFVPKSGDLLEWPVPGMIGCLALRAKGGAVIALADGLRLFDFASGRATPIPGAEAGDPRTRFNDGKVDRQGRFLAGTMAREMREPLGALYRLNSDLSVEVLEREVILANGPCFSPDGRTLYFGDTRRRSIFAYDYDPAGGPLRNKRVLIDTASYDTGPDGATVDAEGYLWSAQVLKGCLRRFAPDGRLDRTIELPVSYPSSVMFGGPGLDVLFVTSISEPLNERAPAEPEAGALLAIHGLGVQGLPESRFAG